jgi:hypothetical protein
VDLNCPTPCTRKPGNRIPALPNISSVRREIADSGRSHDALAADTGSNQKSGFQSDGRPLAWGYA